MSNPNNNNNQKAKNPILPKPGQRNVLITSALPYVNNVPHLGNIVGSVLSADVYSRYLKGRGVNCLFICGTDEYGTATETKAMQEGISPKEICDKYNKIHSDVYSWFNIGFDKFGRTSDPEQTKVTQEIFLKFYNRGYTLEETQQQLFCEKCDRFLADRFVEGTCPFCGYTDARGDQCDKCGKLMNNATELINPACKVCNSRPVVKATKHLNIDLPRICKESLEEWINESIKKGNWSDNAVSITKSWLQEGLKPRCITRDLKWGIKVPIEEYKDKVFYVWYDAPIGYISITAAYTDDWESWWRNPEHVELVQFMGKDNVPFHTVIFPSCLLATGDKFTLLNSISTCEYLNYEGGKFSKSRNTGVFGTDAISSGIPSEVWRYYLLSNRPEISDSSFSWDDLQKKVNGELLANLGNFINRALSFCYNNFNGKLPEISNYILNDDDNNLINNINNDLLPNYIKSLDNIQIKDGLKIVMAISKLGNQYLQENKPWELINTNKERCGIVIKLAINLVKLLSTLISPYMPSLTDKILSQLGIGDKSEIPDKWDINNINSGHVINKPDPLFKKLGDDEIKSFKLKFSGDSGDKNKEISLFPCDIRGGVIIDIKDHPEDPDNLYVIKVDIGKGETRQVIARLKSNYKYDELINRKVVVLCNLPNAQIKNVTSEGMILVAEGKNKNKETIQRLLQVNDDIYGSISTNDWSGTQIYVDGFSGIDNSKSITLKEFQKMDLKIGKESKVFYKAKHPVNAGSSFGQLCAPGVDNGAKIK